MTENLKKYLELQDVDGKGKERKRLLEKMSDEDLDYLIDKAGCQTAKIVYESFKDGKDGKIYRGELKGMSDDELRELVDNIVPGGAAMKAIIYSTMKRDIEE